jgi:hypothetical protein
MEMHLSRKPLLRLTLAPAMWFLSDGANIASRTLQSMKHSTKKMACLRLADVVSRALRENVTEVTGPPLLASAAGVDPSDRYLALLLVSFAITLMLELDAELLTLIVWN